MLHRKIYILKSIFLLPKSIGKQNHWELNTKMLGRLLLLLSYIYICNIYIYIYAHKRTHTYTHRYTYTHTIIYAYNHIHTYIYTNHGFNVVCPKSILIHHCIYLKRNAHILTHVYIHISWLYKTPKSGNGNKISDKM